MAHQERVNYALGVLAHVAELCDEQDMCEDEELQRALNWIAGRMTRPVLCKRFQEALSIPEPDKRRAEINELYKLIERQLGTTIHD